VKINLFDAVQESDADTSASTFGTMQFVTVTVFG